MVEEDAEKITDPNDPAMERIISEKRILFNFLQRTSEELSKALADLEKEKASSGILTCNKISDSKVPEYKD